MTVKLLDCTLRDGGYYCNWSYSKEVVEEYLHAMSLLSVDIIELGLRTPERDSFLGAFAYTTDEYLQTLQLPSKALIGVMINAKDFLKENSINTELLNLTFKNKSESPVGLIRIAAQFKEAQIVPELVKFLQKKGYRVGVNLMQAGGKSKAQIQGAIKEITRDCNFDVLYFADSLGNMNTDHIAELFGIAQEVYSGELGIHAHDNMGNAVANTFKALSLGVTWLDSTVLGMGRGAGNAKTEIVALELKKRNINNYSPEAVFPLVLSTFKELQREYGWGPDLLYYLSGHYNVHPTYVQVMTSDKKTDFHNMISAMDNLKKVDATSFSMNNLLTAISFSPADSEGTWSPLNFIKGKDVLIIGSGTSVKDHAEGIRNYIKLKKPVVISLNINSHMSSEYINAYAACHPVRLLSDIEKYRNLKKPLITPIESLSEEMKKKLGGLEVFNFGLKLSKESFQFEEHGCGIPSPLVLAYCLSLAVSGEANRVLLVGLDGYNGKTDQQKEMDQLLESYFASKRHVPLVALTPTTYNITQSSIYHPNP